jgi:hypothetical protein
MGLLESIQVVEPLSIDAPSMKLQLLTYATVAACMPCQPICQPAYLAQSVVGCVWLVF